MLNREELMRLALTVGLETAKNYEYRGRFEKMTVPEKEEVLQLERFAELVAAKEREAIMDEWAMCMQSDLEHGVKSLNQRAAELWAMTYPQMAGFAALIEKRGATDGKPT